MPSPSPSASPSAPKASAQQRPLADLEDGITSLAAHLDAATHELLTLIADFDARMGWAGHGVRSCAHWLSWKCGIGLVAARDKVRVARALPKLPRISDAMRRGKLSYSKVRAITRIATPETESFLLAVALNGTASHVERLVREHRAEARHRELAADGKRHTARELRYHWDHDGSLVIEARLPPEQGALVLKALQAAEQSLRDEQRAADQRGTHQEDDSAEAPTDETTWAQRQADALALCAETFLAASPRALAAGDRHLVNVHVDLDALMDPEAEGKSTLDDGPRIPPDTVRRLACDGSIVALLEDGQGRTLDVGRKTRAIPPAMRRALQHRDGGCRFPGCTATRHVDGHHIQHWANGGPTSLENLVLLCPFHHRLVHEGGFGVERTEHGPRFLRPDRVPIDDSPRAAAPRVPELGVAITPQTAIPGWGGERMDLSYCLTALAQREARPSPLP